MILLFLIILIIYIYFLYPIFLKIVTYNLENNITKHIKNYPFVTVVMVAYNEENRISKKIENLLLQNYPKDKVQIYIASDGSTDKTNDIITSYNSQKIRPFIYRKQRGKSLRLNQLLKEVATPITIMCDVRQKFHPDAIAELVKNFNDSKVGAVSGKLVLVDDTNSSVNLSLYWKYETFLRKAESIIDSTNGVTGAIYAIRTKLFRPIPEDTILDDVLIPMQIVRQGFRVLYEPKALAYDRVQTDTDKEYKRKVRTLAGNFQLIIEHSWLLNPFQNRVFFQFFSHKVLRLIVPFIFIALLGLTILLLNKLCFILFLGFQLIFHILGIYLFILQRKGVHIINKYLRIINTFYSLNIAILEGLYQYLFKHGLVKWK